MNTRLRTGIRWAAGFEMKSAENSLTTAPISLSIKLNISSSFLSIQSFAGQEETIQSMQLFYKYPESQFQISTMFNESNSSYTMKHHK